MASTIQIKRGTGSAVPSGLADGELAINLDSGKLYFGSGSTSVDNFTFGELTAEKYIVSSSVLYVTTSFSSGSTQFGNSADDSHTFTGDVTASGNISASGTITAEHFYSIDDIVADGDISASGTITANSFTGNGLSIDGPSNSHVEVGEYPVGFDTLGLNTLYITGSGLIISGAMADTNHHNMLKIGDVELLDLNTAVTKNQFLIHNVKSFAITSGSDVGSIVAGTGNTLFKHDGASFFICKGGETTADATIKSSGTTTTIKDTNITLDSDNGVFFRAPNVTSGITHFQVYSANPNTTTQQGESLATSNVADIIGVVKNSSTSSFAVTSSNVLFGNITASGNISSSANLYAADYFDDGANINTIYSPIASPTFTGTVAIPNIANVETAITANTAKATNVSTNLTATTHASQITINSSDGDNVVIAEASDSIAGVMSVAHHDKLDGIEASATADQTQADINGLAITTVGALGSGTIASGFGNIDNGTNTINTGEITATSIKHSISGNNAGDYGPGAEILYGISSDSVTAGAIYTLRSGTWTLIDANTDNRVDRLCAVATIAAGNGDSSDGMLIRGCVTLASAFTAGTDVEGVQVYASETGGQATITAPSDSGDLVRILGYSLNVSSKKMFFNPDSTFLEIA